MLHHAEIQEKICSLTGFVCICFNLRQNVDQPTKGMLIALEQLASHVPQAHKQQIQIAFNNSAWHAISTGYMNSTKETFSVCFI